LELIAYILSLAAYAVFWASALIAALLILRVLVTWLSRNPFNWLSYNLRRVTERIVSPLRFQLDGRFMRYDLIPLAMGMMILLTGMFFSWTLSRMGRVALSLKYSMIFLEQGRIAPLAADMIELVSAIYMAILALRFFLPMFGVDYSNALLRFCFAATEPVIKPLRRIFVIGMVDLSPMVAIFLVDLLTGLLISLVKAM
jgi:uncharacterized protein YggT (Ycf19 family)